MQTSASRCGFHKLPEYVGTRCGQPYASSMRSSGGARPEHSWAVAATSLRFKNQRTSKYCLSRCGARHVKEQSRSISSRGRSLQKGSSTARSVVPIRPLNVACCSGDSRKQCVATLDSSAQRIRSHGISLPSSVSRCLTFQYLEPSRSRSRLASADRGFTGYPRHHEDVFVRLRLN
jgi:hypothetical protein